MRNLDIRCGQAVLQRAIKHLANRCCRLNRLGVVVPSEPAHVYEDAAYIMFRLWKELEYEKAHNKRRSA